MSRSLKKGPFIDPKLEAKVVAQAEGNKKSVIKTWSRASMISPDFVGQTIAVHNGDVYKRQETVWRQADKYNVPRIGYVNKMDSMKITLLDGCLLYTSRCV